MCVLADKHGIACYSPNHVVMNSPDGAGPASKKSNAVGARFFFRGRRYEKLAIPLDKISPHRDDLRAALPSPKPGPAD